MKLVNSQQFEDTNSAKKVSLPLAAVASFCVVVFGGCGGPSAVQAGALAASESHPATSTTAPRTSAARTAQGAQRPNPDGSRNVYINRVRIDEANLQAIESYYQTQIPDGRYWYDVYCGAWGIEGGPTAGFIAAGLQLAGPMPIDVSGGGTGIYINGREIHQQDQLGLHRIFGRTIPGHYFLDHQGNLMTQNGIFIANLVHAMQYGSTTGAGGTVAMDGQGGAMFSAPGLNGKSVFWYSGM